LIIEALITAGRRWTKAVTCRSLMGIRAAPSWRVLASRRCLRPAPVPWLAIIESELPPALPEAETGIFEAPGLKISLRVVQATVIYADKPYAPLGCLAAPSH
jgi:hypothetical protein